MKAKNLKKKKRNLALMEKRAVNILEKYEKEHKEFLVMDDFDGGKHLGLRMAIKDLKFILAER